jgi:NTP pyrophosphatase (non-canonical NTP hydrolase)
VDIEAVQKKLEAFARERDWEQFHSPKNLSMSLAVEAAELMEHFLWLEPAASREVAGDPVKLGEVAEELADVACYVLNLSNALGVDLSDAIAAKMVKNAVKYPAPGAGEGARGEG